MRLPKEVMEAIDGAAAKGAARLDQRRTSWFLDVDTKLLDMGDSCLCISGQLYGEYSRSSVTTIVGGWVRRLRTKYWWSVGENYGFDMPALAAAWSQEVEGHYFNARDYAIWNRLERAWKNQIKARRQALEAGAC